MKTSEIKGIIVNRFKAGVKRSVLIEGSPGIGKTQIVEQVAKELGVSFRVIHAPLMQPEDYGFPVINTNRDNVEFIVSKSKFPVEGNGCPDAGILLIDEIPQADNSGQKILANLIQAREIHGQRIKDGWVIVATGNRVSDRAGANRLLSHLRMRVTTLTLDVSIDDWSQWALSNSVSPELISFIRFRPELLNSFDSNVEINPSPRAWVEGVDKSIGNVDSKLEFECFKGDVGEGAAAEFCAFLKICRKLPTIESILLNPDKADVPNEPSTLYALTGALIRKTDVANFARVMTYVKRMPGEFSVLFMRDLIRKTPAIQSTKEFIQWASGEGANLLS